MKDTLILNDGTAIELESGAALSSMQVLFDDYDAMVATWKMLTEDNLSAVSIKNTSDLVVANYTDLILVSETSVVNSDGTILTSFYLREMTDVEKQLKEIAAEQEVQDEAIEELASVVAGEEETEDTESSDSTATES